MTTTPISDAVTLDRLRVVSTALSVLADTLTDITGEVLDVIGAGIRSTDHHQALDQLGAMADTVTSLTSRVVILAVHSGHLPGSAVAGDFAGDRPAGHRADGGGRGAAPTPPTTGSEAGQ